MVIFFIDNQMLLWIIYDISIKYFFAYFDQIFYRITKAFYINSQVVCIFSEIFKAFSS